MVGSTRLSRLGSGAEGFGAEGVVADLKEAYHAAFGGGVFHEGVSERVLVAERTPGFEVKTIAGSGHNNMYMDQPQAVAEAVRGFARPLD